MVGNLGQKSDRLRLSNRALPCAAHTVLVALSTGQSLTAAGYYEEA